MDYARFEKLVIGLGTAAVIGNMLVSLAGSGWANWPNAMMSLLLLPVLVAAVHSGRKAGLVAALLASAALMVFKAPMLSSPSGMPIEDLAVIAVSVLAFGLVGIVGGELCGRIKYAFARYSHSAIIDDWSHVYNQRRAAELLEQARERHTRYAEPFAVVVISDASPVLSGLRPARQRALVRAAANYLRGDVRMIDEVARLDDGRFVVVLPHTGREGGLVVTDRLLEGVRQTLGATDDAVTARCLTSGDELEIGSLSAGIARTDED